MEEHVRPPPGEARGQPPGIASSSLGGQIQYNTTTQGSGILASVTKITTNVEIFKNLIQNF